MSEQAQVSESTSTAPAEISASAVSQPEVGTQTQQPSGESTVEATQSEQQAQPETQQGAEQGNQQQETGFSYSDLVEDYILNGMSDELKADAEKLGVPLEQFQAAAEAQKAIQLKNNDTIYNLVGGTQAYEELKTFAVDNLPQEVLDGINDALFSGNMEIASIAVLGLKALKEERMGSAPQLRVSGSNEATSRVEPFRSQAEVVQAMNNRRYLLDATYKAEVDSRRRVSKF